MCACYCFYDIQSKHRVPAGPALVPTPVLPGTDRDLPHVVPGEDVLPVSGLETRLPAEAAGELGF